MNDLISRQNAIDALGEEPLVWHEGEDEIAERNQWRRDLNAIKALPSAQPDIIVCADCKHWICHDRRCGYWNHGVKPLDWCCHGERRNDEAD